MNRSKYYKQMLVRIVITFVLLVAGGITMIAIGTAAADAFMQTLLVSVGAATFGAALAFFLVEMFQWGASRDQEREREWGRPLRIHNEQPSSMPK